MRKEIGILLMAVLLAVPLWGCQRSKDTVPEKTVPKATLPKQTAPGKEDPGDQTETIPALDAVSDRGQLMAGAESRRSEAGPPRNAHTKRHRCRDFQS